MKSVGGFGIANIDIIFGNAHRMPRLGEEVYSESCSQQLGGGAVATLQTWSPCKIGDLYWRRSSQQISGKGTEEE